MRLQVHSQSEPVSVRRRHSNQMFRQGCWFPPKAPLDWVLCLCASILLAHVGSADTVTLRATADVELHENAPDSNFGTGLTMVSGGLGVSAGNETRRSLVRFDPTPAIPSGSTVTSATLTVAVTRVPSTPVSSTFGLSRILQPWSETNATWITRLDVTALWSSAGAAGAEDIAATPSSSVLVGGIASYSFASSSNLVADVQLWVDTPSTNFGWLLISDAEESLWTARHFATRESGANGPAVVVEFTRPSAAIPPELRELKRTTNEISFQFSAEAQRIYTVEFTPAFSTPEWQVLTNFAPSTANTNLQFSEQLTAGHRFYRVRTP